MALFIVDNELLTTSAHDEAREEIKFLAFEAETSEGFENSKGNGFVRVLHAGVRAR